jgi:hypothetical protein
MHTPVCDRLAIEFPIFAFSHCRDVVAAVTNAGGFGVLGATGHSPRTLDIDLTWIDEQTKGKPYGVDLLLGRQVEIRGADVMEIVDGLIQHNTIYYDGATFARQIGLLPGLGSRADRALLSVFNAKTTLSQRFRDRRRRRLGATGRGDAPISRSAMCPTPRSTGRPSRPAP